MIRDATIDDVPRLVEMGRRFWADSPYRLTLTENPAQMATIAERLVTQADGVVLVAATPFGLVGMLGLLLFAHHLSAELVAGEVFWYVEPEHRGAGLRLLKQAEEWARAHGARRLQMIAPDTRVGQVYARFGYTPVEVAYQKDLVA